MNKKLIKRFFIIFSVIMFLVSAVIVIQNEVIIKNTFGLTVLDMRLSYNLENVYDFFTGIKADGRLLYRMFLLEDFVFIIFFAVVQYLLLSRLIVKMITQSII